MRKLSWATAEPTRHVVKFYEHDDDLAASVGAFLAAALDAGGAVVVVASDKHRRCFAEALALRGIDVVSARRRGALLERDAAAMLAQLTGPNGPDPRAFEQVVGELVRSAHRQGGPVRVYGEMVALLCDRGDLDDALAIEMLWNDLGGAERFSLFCAYPEPAADDPRAVRQVAEFHAAVEGPLVPEALRDGTVNVTRFFDPVPLSLAAARRLVEEVLHAWKHDELAFDADVVVSELAGNAVLHAGTGFAVTLTRTRFGVRINVADFSEKPPQTRVATPETNSGRGLHLVAGLSSRWGFFPTDSGKSVWANLDSERR